MRKFLILNGYGAGASASVSRATAFFKSSWPGEVPERCLLLCPDEATASGLAGRIPWSRVTAIVKKIYDPEPILGLLARDTASDGLYIFGDDPDSAGLAARLYGRCGGSACIGVCAAEEKNEKLFLRKRVYSHHMEARFLAEKLPCFAALAKGLPTDGETENGPSTPEMIVLEDEDTEKEIIFQEDGDGDSLETAKLLVAGGNGAGGPEGLACLQELAACMGAGFGVSKPAAMGGWAPLSSMIGISGTLAAPELCIAAGVSGAAAFFAGIEKSGAIIAINTDPEAPIMGHADAVVQGDYKEILPELIRLIRQDRSLL
ncbi:MAG TPA: hypothetical protein DF613_06505 [Lachnospiraceae bacterium]|nr:hypothetical protein [Lachnospiraceae bacterium]